MLKCLSKDFVPVTPFSVLTPLYSNFSIDTLDMLHSLGLYINDLSMHDSSRDLVLAGTQQSAELRLALDQV